MRRTWLLTLGLLAGCATGVSATTPDLAPPPPLQALPSPAQARADRDRAELVTLARSWLGHSRVPVRGKHYPADCTSVIRAAYDSLGMDVMTEGHPRDNGVTAIVRYAREHGRLYSGGHPLPGDLVFFRNTYDRNHDGALDDGLTHIALVESEDANGTITLIHRIGTRIVRSHMNLRHPHRRTDPATGAELNDMLRLGHGATRDRLTAELFSTFATLLGPGPLPVASAPPHKRHAPEGRRAPQRRR